MPTAVDRYIASFPPHVEAQLEAMRAFVHENAPGCTEGIKYGMAGFLLDGVYVVYIAGWKKHIGLYPIPKGTPALQKALAPYRDAKATLRFPIDKPVPLPLVARLVRARVKELLG
jgi:uncharacterized protein YdhG (YjbR/CyaY superfamily)